MIKTAFGCFIFLFAFGRICFGQNLVLNPSFEESDTCLPTGIQFVTHWNSINYIYTPDYYSQCPSFSNVPSNWLGTQSPKSGTSYIGCVLWVNSQFPERECATGVLSDTLQFEKQYCISFYVNKADSSDYSIDRIGALITDSAFDIAISPPQWMIDIEPSIENNVGNIISDTISWTKISGIYIARGTEKFILITNFRNNTETQFEYNNNSMIGNNIAYYYIDQVSVEEIKPADAGQNQTIAAGQFVQLGNNTTEDAAYSWTPATGLSTTTTANPTAQPFTTTTYTVTKTQCSSVTTDEVTITVNTNPAIVFSGAFILPSLCATASTAEVLDTRGRLVAAFDATQAELLVAFAPGMYFLRFTCGDGSVGVRRLVVQE